MPLDVSRSAVSDTLRRKRLGMLCILVAVLALTLQDALVKWLSAAFPLPEITLSRSLVAIAVTLVILRLEGGAALLRTRRPGLHALRAALLLATSVCFFTSIASMPLAEATAIFFVGPLFITALSVPLLGERVGPRRWAAVLVGMAGVLVMMRPGSGALDPVALLPVGAALAYALLQIVTRRLGRTDRASAMAFYVHLAFVAASAAAGVAAGDGRFAGTGHVGGEFLLRAWSWPRGPEVALLLGCGVLIGIGAWCLSQAYRVAPPAHIAPLEYAALPLSVVWGGLLWGEWPDGQAALGMALIAGSGLYVFHRETARRRGLR